MSKLFHSYETMGVIEIVNEDLSCMYGRIFHDAQLIIVCSKNLFCTYWTTTLMLLMGGTHVTQHHAFNYLNLCHVYTGYFTDDNITQHGYQHIVFPKKLTKLFGKHFNELFQKKRSSTHTHCCSALEMLNGLNWQICHCSTMSGKPGM